MQEISASDYLIEMSNEARIVIGIFGPPGSGKTTVSNSIMETINYSKGTGYCAYIPMDGFHLSNRILEARNLRSKKGAPETFDTYGYAELLHRVQHCGPETIFAPDYSRSVHEPIAASLEISPASKIILTEGNYLALPQNDWAAVRTHTSELWFLESDLEALESRLISRQIQAGKSELQAMEWFTQVDRPNIRAVLKTKHTANRILRIGEDGPMTYPNHQATL